MSTRHTNKTWGLGADARHAARGARPKSPRDTERDTDRTSTDEARTAASAPPRLDEIRAIALALPAANKANEQADFVDSPWFRVRKKTFALCSRQERSWIFKLPHALQDEVFTRRPETFLPMRAGAMVWSYVVVEHLAPPELRTLQITAWRMMAPKKLWHEVVG